PSPSEQQRMIAAAADYLSSTIPKLPNLYARRKTIEFADAPALHDGNVQNDSGSLRFVHTASETVIYRDGGEFADAADGNPKKSKLTNHSLVTYGTFGPVLRLAQSILGSPATITWARWEQDEGRRRAVFHYSLPARSALYSTMGCCTP